MFADRSPLAWTDLVPSWPEDVELDPGSPVADDTEPRRPPSTPPSTAPIDPSAWTGVRPAWAPPDSGAPVLPSAGAFSGGGLGDRLRAFDPGSRGAKALAVVAVVVVIIAAFLAWRARPRVDQVAPSPSGVFATTGGAATPDPGEPSKASPSGAEVVVSVAGKVASPGLVRLPPGARVADALAAAGGARPGVDVAMLNLARKVVDGELILVGVTPPPGTVTQPPGGPGGAAPGGAAPGGPVNLNTATLADLDTLPGVGPVLAQRILDARDAAGGFRAVTDLRTVDGIGQSRYEQLKDLVTV